ncbi:unnamed protein product [Eretmochelys imbricata]
MQLEEKQKLHLEHRLAWLRRELSEMQLQDQQLLEKLLQLHTSMQELKVECAYWESSETIRETIRARARSSSEDMGAPVPTGASAPSLKGETSRRNSIP